MLEQVNADLFAQQSPDSQKTSFQSSIGTERAPNRNNDDYIVNPYYTHCPAYDEAYQCSLEDPENFWGKVSKCIDWSKPWTKVLDNSNPPFTKWFIGGELNACYNAVDRHVLAGNGDKVALIHDSPLISTIRPVTYNEMLEKTSKLAGYLAEMGVGKGDVVIIYMPLIPETVIAILATARLGAIHSVVFGGFAANELASRINHAKPKVMIAASCGLEPTKVIHYTDMLIKALSIITVQKPRCIVFQRRNVWESTLNDDLIDWDTAMAEAKPHPCQPVNANDPLYILYTSGTTGQPKGILRTIGGHLMSVCWTMNTVYGLNKDSVWWAASDMGWVVGLSYICYGPLIYGATSVMYEGKPDRTPNAAQYFRVIDQHKVNALFCVPTVLRVIKRDDGDRKLSRKYSTKSLKTIFVAGEFCDYETKIWAEQAFKVPVLNHWWQSETGHPITALCLGYGHCPTMPKNSTGLPIPGYRIDILREDGSKALIYEMGKIAIKLPLPPGCISTLYEADDRFKQIYFSRHPGYYDTMDVGYKDECGFVYVMARDDDIINVAGHRLSTVGLEDVIMAHPDVIDAAVVGVPDPTKGEVPLCLYIMRPEPSKSEEQINEDLVAAVRSSIGPIASFRTAAAVRALPRTRSGKIIRKSIAILARSKLVQVMLASRPVAIAPGGILGRVTSAEEETFGLQNRIKDYLCLFRISSTIEDASVYHEIKEVLQKLGYAKLAPDPQ